MVNQHTPGGDEDRAGLSASSDAPISRVHAHARDMARWELHGGPRPVKADA